MSQLEKRKFRKGAVHNRKKVFTENNEKIETPNMHIYPIVRCYIIYLYIQDLIKTNVY